MPWRREEDFLRNNEFSLYDLCGHAPAQNPCPGGHESNNYGRLYFGHWFLWTMLCIREEVLSKDILHFLTQNVLPLGLDVMKFTFSGLLPLHMLHNKFGEAWSSRFLEEDGNGRRPTHENGCPPNFTTRLFHSNTKYHKGYI